MTLHQLEIYFLIKPSQYCYFYAATAVTLFFTALHKPFQPPTPLLAKDIINFFHLRNKHKKGLEFLMDFINDYVGHLVLNAEAGKEVLLVIR